MDQTQVSVQIALETSRGVPGDGHAETILDTFGRCEPSVPDELPGFQCQ